MCSTFGLDRAGDLRVGIFGQENRTGDALIQGFSDLLCANDQAFIFQFAALGDLSIFFSVHAKTYYTHFLEKVNKNYLKFLYK